MSCDVASTGAAATPNTVILPGATLGLLGGGQLGRMFTVAARTLGYRVTVLDPDDLSPAAEFATRHLCTAYTDPDRSTSSRAPARRSRRSSRTRPRNRWTLSRAAPSSARAAIRVAVAQDRALEKAFLHSPGIAAGSLCPHHVARPTSTRRSSG
jgi:5-(carboxyamino)imidazole ribonucleotide synthase